MNQCHIVQNMLEYLRHILGRFQHHCHNGFGTEHVVCLHFAS